MARLPAEQINRIKQDISLLRLVESQGHVITTQGKDSVICCPFHDDKTPSCVISPKSNLFNCFGCGAAGSVIDWVMKTQGLSFRLACELLQKDIGAVVAGPAKPIKHSTAKKLTSSLAADLLAADAVESVNQVVDYYHQTLKDAPEALAYLEKRGLNYPELINTFKLGFANRTLAYHIPQNNREAGKAIRTQLKAIGLLRKTGHEHFNGALVVPIIDDRHYAEDRSRLPASRDIGTSVCGMYGRRINDDNQNKGAPKHLYLPGPHAGVWNADGLHHHNEVILCESLIDAMTFWVHGFEYVTASYGTQGFSDDHLALFKACGVQRVLIAYDRDQAGETAASTVAKVLQAAGLDCFRVLVPHGLDVNQWATEAKTKAEAQERLSSAIRKAQWLGNGKPPERQILLDLPAIEPVTPEPIPAAQPTATPTNTTLATPPLPVSEPDQTSLLADLFKDDEALALPDLPELLPEPLPETAPASQPPLPASPLPKALTDDVRCEVTEREVILGIGDRVYRIRGLNRNSTEGQLKINLMAMSMNGRNAEVQGGSTSATSDHGYHTDTLELYHAKARQVFINQASAELGVKDSVIKKDLGKVLLKLESLQDEQRASEAQKTVEVHRLTPEEKTAALALLTDKHLLSRIGHDFNQLGLIGEDTNKLVGYLACVSRKLDKPLGVVIQSSSAAGKSSLMEAILQLVPEEDRVQYSAMTGQSLFYMGETNLKHKILAIAEEEGASNASYALKLLQSEGEITIASTGKDETTGDLVTKDYRVEGPTQLFMTTTAIDVDEELMNRCIVLSVDESKAQTEAIHAQQRYGESLAGVFAKTTKNTLVEQHQNAQRLLKPYAIVNPYAEHLQFLSDKTRTRRDHVKYLTLIKTITLLHQYQREIKTFKQGNQTLDYLEVTLSDIEKANDLVHQVLGKSLDELPPQTRNLLNQIQAWVTEQCAAKKIAQSDVRFSRRDVRELSGWTDNQLKVHCRRLQELEYLLVHRGGRGQSFTYELLYDGKGANTPHMMGLIDISTLRHQYDEKRLGQAQQKMASSCPPVGPELAGSWPPVGSPQSSLNGVYSDCLDQITPAAHRG